MEAQTDVMDMLGIKKTDDMIELEKKKAEAMMSAVHKFAHLLTRTKSPAELSKTKWRAVARLYRDGKLTFAHMETLEGDGSDEPKIISWSSAKFAVEDDITATIRAQFEPQYNEFSKVSTLAGDKACVATRLNGNDSLCACAYFDGCITVFDVDEQVVFNTQDVGCLKQMPSGDWKMTEQDDDTIAVMNLRWCPGMEPFMAATATGGILAIWQVSHRVQELVGCMREDGDAFYGLDWTNDGKKIVVGGSEKKVKVFDPYNDMACVLSEFDTKLKSVDTVAGHINRVTAVKASPREASLICSAALDNTVQLWDIRMKDFAGACTGALVEGDALDMDASGRYILTAGANNEGPRIDIWDIRTQTAVYQSRDIMKGTIPTCVGFSKGSVSKYIHVGGTTANLASVFRAPSFAASTPIGQMLDDAPLDQIARISEVNASFRCLGCANRSNTVAYGNNDGLVSIVDYSLP
jgi:WD40 repeat protein